MELILFRGAPSISMQLDPAQADSTSRRSPWSWVPSLYFAEGIPYVLVNTVSVIVFKKLGVSNADIAFYTSLLGFPWVIKPLWGPLVDLYWTKRRWVLLMQVVLGISFGVLALTLHSPFWWIGSLIAFGAAAFLSATHDIAADGFYMIGLDEHRQALYVGVRSTFYRLATIFGTGLLVMFAGVLESKTGPKPVPITMAAGPPTTRLTVVQPPLPGDEFLRLEPRTASLSAGTTTALQVSLAKPPASDRTVVSINRRNSSPLAFFFAIGPEQQITIKAGDRLEFTKENWDKPQQVVFGADAKLREEALATYQATAGNIPLTWSLCFAGLAGLFLLVAGLHGLVLPRPALDGYDAGQADRKPFWLASSALLGTMFVPLAAFVAAFYLLKLLVVPAVMAVIDMEQQKAGAAASFGALFEKARNSHTDVRTFAIDLLIVVLVWFFYRSAAVRRGSMRAFHWAARGSGMAFDEVFISFFRKPGIVRMIAFLLLFRLGEALLLKLATPFLLDVRTKGGIGLTQADYGLAYGMVGILALICGGILGGIAAGSGGLKKWLIPMCLAVNVPNLLYVYLAYAQPESFFKILLCVAGEQFGYGFGFAAYMVYMLYIAGQGQHKTSHFALCTGFMALSMMLPGMISGAISDMLGYKHYFVLVVAAGLPGLLLLPFIPLDPEFGKKTRNLQ
ncbi:MAG: hypothetical protein ACR2IE_15245 [Candidatus Sumerlaeaceae bacterium]